MNTQGGLFLVSTALALAVGCAATKRAETTTATSSEMRQCERVNSSCTDDVRAARTRVLQLDREVKNERARGAFIRQRMESYRSIAKELMAVFEPEHVRIKIRRGLMIVQLPNEVLFEFGSAVIGESGKEVLKTAAKVLRGSPDRRYLIAGHTDNVPVKERNPEYSSNWELSALRSLAVVNYLQSAGVPPQQLAVVGYGEYMPEETGDSERARAANRRTEFIVMPTIDELPAMPDEDLSVRPVNDGGRGVQSALDTRALIKRLDDRSKLPAEPSSPAVLRSRRAIYPTGMGIAAGGGFTDFTESSVRDFTDPGGQWGARFVYGTRSLLAVEAAYMGGAQDIAVLGLDASAILLSTGLEGNARVNFSASALQPYAFVGAAWKRYDVVNADTNTSSLQNDDSVFETPFGLGVSYRIDNLILDARAVMRPAFGADLGDAVTPSEDASLHNYGVVANIGLEL